MLRLSSRIDVTTASEPGAQSGSSRIIYFYLNFLIFFLCDPSKPKLVQLLQMSQKHPKAIKSKAAQLKLCSSVCLIHLFPLQTSACASPVR